MIESLNESHDAFSAQVFLEKAESKYHIKTNRSSLFVLETLQWMVVVQYLVMLSQSYTPCAR